MPALDPETRERWRDMVMVDRESATVGTIETSFSTSSAVCPPGRWSTPAGWGTGAAGTPPTRCWGPRTGG